MAGRIVNQYEILEQLGQGGMGVVFKARDTRLGRLVALKFLPQSLADDPVAMERLRREARAASSLNHPHICTLHDFGEADGRPFIVMELLEGETLRRRLASGALPPDQVVELGLQIADALEAAHGQGILHRDIKPENIFLTRRGAAKLMDFGLAKFAPLHAGREPAGSATPTASMPPDALTGPGTAIGTVAYMSPEQARGQELDARSDLFSFGAVLYEMATGAMAFPGPTTAVIFDAILNRTPRPARDMNGRVPERLEQVIDKTLEKDRALRSQSAAEIGADLKRLKRATESERSASRPVASPPVATPRATGLPSGQGWRRRALVAGLAAGGLVVVTLLALRVRLAPAGTHEAPRELQQRQLTGFGSEQRVISTDLSPDGKMLALVTPRGLFIQILASGVTQPVPLPEEFRTGLWSVDWFPDGASLAVGITDPDEPRRGTNLYAVSMLGGTPRLLQKVASDPRVSPDGAQVAFWAKEGLLVAGSDGTDRRVLVEGASEADGQYGLDWSPDGQSVLFASPPKPGASEASLEEVPLRGGPPVTLASIPEAKGVAVAWARDGRIFYITGDPAEGDANLWELRTAPRDHRVMGAPRKVTHLVGAMTAELSVSDDAKRMAILRVNILDTSWVGDLASGGRRLDNVHSLDTDLRYQQFPIAWMSGGESILVATVRNEAMEIGLRPPGQEQVQVLATGLKDTDEARVTPDGSWLLFENPAPGADGDAQAQTLMRLGLPRGSP
ncbi:MAG TPA: protein kinase, partial [Candidatus Polarisedimenticolia bacterium]|nr:protein kinase [Candidatus Polarisedimenticolia bacterium]